MFRTFKVLAPEYLGEITLLFGHLGGKPAPRNFVVDNLKYKSPYKGFRASTVVVEGNHQLPVSREGDQWKWATEPPARWETREGIPYELEEAYEARYGRPYGFNLKGWEELKTNFMRHATKKQSDFPKDFYVNVDKVKAMRAAQKVRLKEARLKRDETKKIIASERARQQRKNQAPSPRTNEGSDSQ
jgi:hypothetical protein